MEHIHRGLAVLALLCLLLAGCGPGYTKRYSPPPSEHGMSCISSCSMQRSHCKQMSSLQERNERALYRAEMKAYEFCKESKSKDQARRSCQSPIYPFSAGRDYSCSKDYDACYEACGGTIQRIKNKD